MTNHNNSTGRAIIAVLVVWVSGFFLGWLIFGIALMKFYESNMTHYDGLMKSMPDMAMLILGNLIWSITLVYILHYLAAVRSLGRGFVIGLIVTLLMTAGFDIYMYASMNLYSGNLLFVDILTNGMLGGILGGIAGWVLGLQKKESAITGR